VRAAHAAAAARLPFGDREDFADADRGFVATLPDALIRNAAGHAVWSMKDYAFLSRETAPDTVHPSLWRQARLNVRHGLFKVVDGLYQVRGFDISNMTLIEGRAGVIVIDPLTTAEVARAGLELYYRERGRRPVVAVLYTHTHVDHWGGVRGVLPEDGAEAVPIIAPEGFMEHAGSENIIAGNAMLRRAQYQFGPLLAKGARGQVDAGLGKTVTAGRVTLVAPNDLVRETGETRGIDGVEIVFQMAPGSEAPAEFHMYYPQFKTLNLAENCTHTFHNLLPFRGAPVRDARAWSQYLNGALHRWGGQADVMIAQHHWPVWGNPRIQSMLKQQRDLYQYVHDQTVRLMNHGYPAADIAERLELPASLSSEWHLRGYYGTVRHNAKAVYQKYLGWYDANPATLDALPPAEAGRKFVEYMGGAAAVMKRARRDFKQGNYRWVAQVLSHVVFAEPERREARELAADAFEQLGYLAEAATWRNAYLMGARELRHGMPRIPAPSAVSRDAIRALPVEQVFDYLAVRLNGPRAGGIRLTINWDFTDTGQHYALNLEHAALTYVPDWQAPSADATLTLSRPAFDALTSGQTPYADLLRSGEIVCAGDSGALGELLALLDDFPRMFPIVEPVTG
jgi:alkyl sulfatase BDS1-like metallo-beta-lactamase superfamily hydrolase